MNEPSDSNANLSSISRLNNLNEKLMSFTRTGKRNRIKKV